MNHDVIITCALTGAGDTVGKHPAIPVTPAQIAAAAVEAAKAGATVVHCHVRESDGRPSRSTTLYKEVVDRIRSSGTDVPLPSETGASVHGDGVPVQRRRPRDVEREVIAEEPGEVLVLGLHIDADVVGWAV